jgi:uncharacterized protein YkwD
MKSWMTMIVVLTCAMALSAAPAAAAGESQRCQVATSVLRVRAAPDAVQIGTAYGGTWLTVTARDADARWVQVEWADRQAWVMAQWVRCDGALESLSVAAAVAGAETAESASGEAAVEGVDPLALAMYEAVNAVRAKYGLAAYNFDARAAAAAQWQAEDMVFRRYFAHNTPDGRRPADLMIWQGLKCGWCGQNIIMGWTADEITHSINWFMNSAPHRANLLHGRYSAVGIGVAQVRPGLRYYVLNFHGD